MKTLNPPNYYMGSAYTFQGFIYPDTEFIDPDTPIPIVVTPKTKKFPWYLYSRKLRKSHLTQ